MLGFRTGLITNMDKSAHVGIGVFVFNDDEEVLMGVRKSEEGHGMYQFPGGRLEWQETFSQCAAREYLEECGVDHPADDFRFITVLNII